ERTLGTITLLYAEIGFGVPSIVASFRSTVPGAPALVFAAGTNPDPETATGLALDNLALSLRYALEIKAHVPRLDKDAGPWRVTTAADHLNYWGDAANTSRASFLFSSKKRIEFKELPLQKSASTAATLEDIIGRIGKEGLPVLFADLTTRDVRET